MLANKNVDKKLQVNISVELFFFSIFVCYQTRSYYH